MAGVALLASMGFQETQTLVGLAVDRFVLAEYYSNTMRVEEGTPCRP